MSEKLEIIRKMLEMQKQFIAKEQAGGLDPKDYYDPESGDDLDGFQAGYDELANKLVDLAHAEKGSKR
ncbi:MAG: hypothetical protein OXN16_16140 [Gammaproteobacteria bacterium]|nr:hypothetical protein [Gammaproteobacteria bacterium]MDE0282581.1 hypothetical protein [Gammaproteobacteria bacterium]MDE0713570.1 hypothetical protein [Gammaproteobacteria bacterium]MXY64770.1 hypothetical protein [Gammaproteobacteria bacterium]MYG66756.1 hypothetical protein [Gammaproteobacteria bacterium]